MSTRHARRHDRLAHTFARGLGPAAALAIAAGASAQCAFSISDVPDFDQRRSAGPGVPGLPADGGMYCAPTSVMNWFAYFANRGSPQPLTFDGPRNWQSNANYNRVTNALSIMGTLMNTSPTNGTTGNGEQAGTFTYGLAYCFPFTVSSSLYYCGGPVGCPSAASMYVVSQLLGGYISACYGYYNESPSGFWTRSGGHCITVVGLQSNDCTSGTLSIRDPADDAANTNQSLFKTQTFNIVPVTANFRGKAGQSFTADTRLRAVYGGPGKFFDGWEVIFPQFGLTASPTPNTPDLQIIRPFRLFGTNLPTITGFSKPAGTGAILDLALHPGALEHYYITAALAPQPARVWKLDLATGISNAVLTGGSPRGLVFDRFGVLYVQDNTTLFAYDPRSPQTPLASQPVGVLSDSIASDDRLDQVVVLTQQPVTGGPRQLRVYPRSLSAPATAFNLSVSLLGDGSVAPDPTADNTFWVCGSQSRIVSRQQIVAGALTQIEFFTLPAGINPTGLNAGPDGHLFFTSGGVAFEYYKPAGAGWQPFPNSAWAGKPGGTRFAVSRPRTNFEPALHTGPEFDNVLNPEIAPTFTIDCYANCDASTVAPVLNAGDFSCFLARFQSGLAGNPIDTVYANCDESTTPPVLNAGDFVCFLQRFRAGCP